MTKYPMIIKSLTINVMIVEYLIDTFREYFYYCILEFDNVPLDSL